MAYRVLVTGSRNWTDKSLIWREMAAIDKAHRNNAVLIHGGAAGADYMAWAKAFASNWEIEIFVPEWEKYGSRAGIIRNIQMVNSGPDICLAFIKDNSRGASHCADFAESRGIPVKRFLA